MWDGLDGYRSHATTSVNTRMGARRYYRPRANTRARLRVNKSKVAHEDLFVRDLEVFLGEVTDLYKLDVRES